MAPCDCAVVSLSVVHTDRVQYERNSSFSEANNDGMGECSSVPVLEPTNNCQLVILV